MQWVVNRMEDLTGRRFGRLIVIEKTEERRKQRVVWLCQCDCGNMARITSSNLKSGKTTSCGCARRHTNRMDITGQRFGRLVAVFPTDKHSYHSVIWHCRCDCGGEADVSAINLRRKQTQSCGCLASENGKQVVQFALSARQSDYIDGTDVKQLLRPLQSNNTSGITGVSYDKSVGLWKAYIQFKGVKYRLGGRMNKEDAVALRKEAEKQTHEKFLEWYKSITKDK